MPSRAIQELFRDELNRGIDIYFGGRTDIEYIQPTAEEIADVEKCFDLGVSRLAKISPVLASEIMPQKSMFTKWAGVAKAKFPGTKSISFPGQSGNIGVNFLVPALIKYYATPSSTYPCYTSYPVNSWDITLTAGTEAYLFGAGGTSYYKASPTTEKHQLTVIAKNGVIEIGTSPKIDQMRLYSQADTKYGPWTAHPLIDVTIEPNKTIYQYPTIGAVPLYHDFGIQWGIMPRVSGVSTIKLIGLSFYEHDLFNDVTYVS